MSRLSQLPAPKAVVWGLYLGLPSSCTSELIAWITPQLCPTKVVLLRKENKNVLEQGQL